MKRSQASTPSGDERCQTLPGWDDTAADFSKDMLVHQLFDAQVARAPDARAIGFGAESLTYAELNARSNQLACHLRKFGVGPERLVGICVERSLEMVIGLLGILKAGGAYTPLDPDYPQERLAFMLADSGVSVVVTQQTLLDRLPSHGAKIMCLDSDREAISKESEASPSSDLCPENLAYVIYTSGSTGRPKGVEIEHRGLANLVRWHLGAYRVTRRDRASQVAALSFDAAVWELWPYLTAGASIELLDEETRRSPEQVRDFLVSRQVTIAFLPTPLAEAVLPLTWPGDTKLRTLLTGGDVLHAHPRPGLPFRLINNYGPTENTVVSTFGEVTVGGEGRPPIGTAVDNVRTHLLDRHLRLVPSGVPGELYLAGDSLARGYLGSPELTAEHFIPDPFSPVPGGRLYRTGDVARDAHDGVIEYVGRVDFQVKIRGHRIELGEIEALLEEHPQVTNAVVLARVDHRGDQRLVAYVVPRHPRSFDADSVRAWMKATLPEYMIPSALMPLDEVPLTPHGKVDRAVLPAPDWTQVSKRYAAPRTPMEGALAGIWARVLKLERVGVEDDFLELGGHSLLAAQVSYRASEAFGVEVPLRWVFDERTVAALARRIERALKGGEQRRLPALFPSPRGDASPLSFAQERLWFLDQLSPGQTTYSLPEAYRLTGRLDIDALRKSVATLTERHQSLRTTFTSVEGVPAQKVAARFEASFEVVELGEEVARQRLEAEAVRPFDLEKGPLFRAGLLRLGEEQHIFWINMHHIISDGWSVAVMWKELEAIYTALVKGETPRLDPLPIQYRDFAAWQRQWLTGEVLEQQISYWRRQLRGVSPLDLPADKVRPAVQSHHGSVVSFQCSEELRLKLERLSRDEGCTLFMTLLAAFEVLLHRYSLQEDICVGVPMSGRNHEKVEGLMGFFVNTLVLRSDVSAGQTFKDLLRQVRRTALEAYAHQDVPFEKLVAELNPTRDMSRSPLFQVMFQLWDGAGLNQLAGLHLEKMDVRLGVEQFDVSCELVRKQNGLEGQLSYATDLFDEPSIRRLVAHYIRLLERIVENPDHPVGDLDFLSKDERQQILLDWNDTAKDFPRGSYVHELFGEQAKRTPDAAAAVFEDESLTYRELDERSNQLACFLRRRGVGPEVLVGICLDRSLEMIVGLLGILKSGAAYVPLDPNYPPQRLAFMVADSAAQLILTRRSFASRLAIPDSAIVCFDTEWARIANELPRPPPPTHLNPSNPAYVIYTSGSTGVPKAVMVEHRNLLNFAQWHNRIYAVRPEDRVTQYVVPSFDSSIGEIWPNLVAGASIHFVPEDIRLAPERLRDWIAEKGITIAFFPTAVAEEMLLLEWPKAARLRTMFTGGERLLRHPTQAHRFVLINEYGPTENTVISTWGRVPATSRTAAPPPIGRPADNVRAYVLDHQMTPVPIGVAGELFVGGAGLARGYLQRPDTTAERFLPDPFGAPGGRLYRTGDLVRFVAGGTTEFLGRRDHQVKVRGFRIELGEVEGAVAREGVSQCVVVVREDLPGAKRLVAYLVPQDGTNIDVAALRAGLKKRLPDYMVPSAFVPLDKLPLTPNGKVDRKALPAPEIKSAKEFVAPQTPVEQILTKIWGDVLGVARVGIEDNFFELGGHSLLVVRCVTQARSAGLPVYPQDFFQHSNVLEMARMVQGRLVGTGGATGDGLPAGGWTDLRSTVVTPFGQRSMGPVPLAYPEERMFRVCQAYRRALSDFTPTSAFIVHGRLDVRALERAYNGFLAGHDILWSVYSQSDGVVTKRIEPWSPQSVEVRDFSRLSADERVSAALEYLREAVRKGDDLGSPPPRMKLTVCRIDDNRHAVLALASHAVFDGTSLGIFWSEVGELYGRASKGESLPSTRPKFQYDDFARWQRRWLTGRVVEEGTEHWRKYLEGAVPLTRMLPSDRPRQAMDERRERDYLALSPVVGAPWALGAGAVQSLNSLAATQGVPLTAIWIAAIAATLGKRAGSNDVLLNIVSDARNRLGLEGTVGCFTNSFLLRLHLDGVSTPARLAARVGEEFARVLGLPEFQLVPFVYPRQNDFFRVLCNFLGTTEVPTWPGLRFETIKQRDIEPNFVFFNDVLLQAHQMMDGSLEGSVFVNADLWSEGTAREVAADLTSQLQWMASGIGS
jgi:amino acid adenylation domain-containing protein